RSSVCRSLGAALRTAALARVRFNAWAVVGFIGLSSQGLVGAFRAVPVVTRGDGSFHYRPAHRVAWIQARLSAPVTWARMRAGDYLTSAWTLPSRLIQPHPHDPTPLRADDRRQLGDQDGLRGRGIRPGAPLAPPPGRRRNRTPCRGREL